MSAVTPTERPKQSPFRALLRAFMPNEALSRPTMQMLIVVQFAIFILIWINSPFLILPRPLQVAEAIKEMWAQGVGQDLIQSFTLNIKAIGLTLLISLGLSYLTVMPFFRPIANG